jgi:polypeptide N-acetylgalactosaminyltransferase
MARRRCGLLKSIILITIIWFSAILIFSFRTDSLTNKDIPINVVNQIVSHESIVDRIKKALPFQQQNIDHDHPLEERIEAIKQAKQMNVQVQVVAPEIDDHRNVSGPGEMGKPVRINKDKLTEEERKKYDEGWKNNSFNQYVSDMISLRRNLPDFRDPECKKINFHPNLSDTSVIIIFHNEARSTLLRTIWSVLDRSPSHLLKEIIIVDDFSDKGSCYR